jgi:ABC-type bacteriocin/lantibiotic exporter with double-glycine peptidase domain
MKVKNKNMKKLFILSLFIYLSGIVLAMANPSLGKNLPDWRIDEKRLVIRAENKNLCGVNSLYLALKFLGEKNVNRENLIAEFEDVRNKGTNLLKIKSYLEKKGYPCRLMEISVREFAKMPRGVIAIVYEENEDEKKLSHVFLMRCISNAGIHVIDFPQENRLKEEDLNEEEMFCLLVAKDERMLPSEKFLSGRMLYAFNVLFIIACVVVAVFIFKQRRRGKT